MSPGGMQAALPDTADRVEPGLDHHRPPAWLGQNARMSELSGGPGPNWNGRTDEDAARHQAGV